MASGWESEGWEFEPWLEPQGSPRLYTTKIPSQSVPLMIDFARCTIKLKKYWLRDIRFPLELGLQGYVPL